MNTESQGDAPPGTVARIELADAALALLSPSAIWNDRPKMSVGFLCVYYVLDVLVINV